MLGNRHKIGVTGHQQMSVGYSSKCGKKIVFTLGSAPSPDPPPSFLKIKFYFKNIKSFSLALSISTGDLALGISGLRLPYGLGIGFGCRVILGSMLGLGPWY